VNVRSNKSRNAHSAEVSDHLLDSRTIASNQETLLQNYRQVGTASAISATLRAQTFGRRLSASAARSGHLRGSVRNGARTPRRPRFQTHTEINVSPEDDVELRQVRISNGSCHNANYGG
jgi:hypothetical protein